MIPNFGISVASTHSVFLFSFLFYLLVKPKRKGRKCNTDVMQLCWQTVTTIQTLLNVSIVFLFGSNRRWSLERKKLTLEENFQKTIWNCLELRFFLCGTCSYIVGFDKVKYIDHDVTSKKKTLIVKVYGTAMMKLTPHAETWLYELGLKILFQAPGCGKLRRKWIL